MNHRNIYTSLIISLATVTPSLSFVPQSQQRAFSPKNNIGDRLRSVVVQQKHVTLAATTDDDDSSSSITTEIPNTEDGKMKSIYSESVQKEAREMLESVGWAGVAPDLSDPEQPMTSDDPFVQSIDAGIRADFGVGLDDLLNPAKVVNLERELFQLREELGECNKDDRETLEMIATKIEKKESKLAVERRSVFRDWLKNIFIGQAVISFGASYVMATNPSSLFGGFDWYYYNSMDISITVLGYWFWWLFIIPSLRSRRPRGFEKDALDIAFLATPIVSLLAPVVTKDTGLIWDVNFLLVSACYGYAYLKDQNDDDDSGNKKNKKKPAWLKFIYNSLDFGSGQERGVRQ
eukprot:CAMPEP_0194133154 /NCGR_PEP_ID=MMETSP0152-20130528/3447_1 /TAXON_ID=1049557 /ORGANISM="Thalassiothrix antarctica, Strain L6-D1" /LENGTH=347 /DNA_ID=CAMNT_0038828417 /DNA_START=94 /DNA_END=1137 /DNA_ORIENTATION=-